MTIFFNAFHSPLGAHASFTLGCAGAKGGFGLELGKPADQNVYIGVETRKGGTYEALPFFEGSEDESRRYDHAGKGDKARSILQAFSHKKITREFRLGTDTFAAGDLRFTLHSPVLPAPDPHKSRAAQQQAAYCPAIGAELTIDNTGCSRARRAFFGFTKANTVDALVPLDRLPAGLTGLGAGRTIALVTDAKDAVTGQGFSLEQILSEPHMENYRFILGATGAILLTVPAGKKITFRFALCFHRAGIVTTGEAASYWYGRFFKNIEGVATYALKNFPDLRAAAVNSEKLFGRAKLNAHQLFQLRHAIRSYYGSTQLLELKKQPFWIVNEGEYRMLNTFDLTVDQLFYEMKLNPWTVRNVLDLYVERYSYRDTLHFPGEKNTQPGGLSFTHDMGFCNHISRAGHSTYEKYGLTGCFSHMTHEQLVNWVLCATVYVQGSGDARWQTKRLPIFKQCLQSMLNRDHPQEAKRNGIMGLDSSRTLEGAEITTYDSLDESLGQARNNVYLAVKTWAAYRALAILFARKKLMQESATAAKQAERAAATIAAALNQEGFIPAIIGEDCNSKIIPAIEGLVFPCVLGDKKALRENGEFGILIRALKAHLATVLRKGTCIYPDGGWKLSSSADNSWLSKIYLCQYVARSILGVKSPAAGAAADKAHAAWLLKEENLYWAWSDQMKSGVAHGSKYYPRGVTAILWLDE